MGVFRIFAVFCRHCFSPIREKYMLTNILVGHSRTIDAREIHTFYSIHVLKPLNRSSDYYLSRLAAWDCCVWTATSTFLCSAQVLLFTCRRIQTQGTCVPRPSTNSRSGYLTLETIYLKKTIICAVYKEVLHPTVTPPFFFVDAGFL